MERAQELTRPADPDEARRLREEGERLEQLLGEVERIAGPTTWPRVEELVHRLVALYGAGLERILACVTEAGALSGPLQDRLCADELVSHLLMLHGLHPVPIADRIARALEEVRPYLKSHAGGVELLGIDPHGVVRLRLEGTCRGCPSSQATVEHTLRRAIEDAAPEVSGVRVETGAPADLVPLRAPSKAGPPSWERIDDLPPLGSGDRWVLERDGARVLFLKVQDALLAYRGECRCGAALDNALLEEATLRCVACGGRFDVVHGGRGLDRAGGLSPIPLLAKDGTVRIALGGAAR